MLLCFPFMSDDAGRAPARASAFSDIYFCSEDVIFGMMMRCMRVLAFLSSNTVANYVTERVLWLLSDTQVCAAVFLLKTER